jgi:hypothetical protein
MNYQLNINRELLHMLHYCRAVIKGMISEEDYNQQLTLVRLLATMLMLCNTNTLSPVLTAPAAN